MSPRPHSLRFLLYLEWILLGIVAFSETLSFPLLRSSPHLSLLNFLGLVVFAMMGSQLPTTKSQKVIYTSAEIALILLMSLVGGIRLFALLYIVLVNRNCLILTGLDRSIVTGIAGLLCVLTQFRRFQSLALLRPAGVPERLGFILLGSMVLFGLVIVCLQLLVSAVLAERQSREQLAVANAQLRQYALKIEEIATWQERNRIAREIHDSLGHSLTVFNLHLEAALRLLQSDPTEARALLVEAKQLGKTALSEVRQSVAVLRSDPLQGRSLQAAVTTLVDDFRKSTGIVPVCILAIDSPPIDSASIDSPLIDSSDYHFDQQLDRYPIPAEVKTAAYRIVQEALTNISKYAAATQVEIHLQAAIDLEVRIEDNGKGFDLKQNTTGFGIQGMRERTQALAGKFAIVTAPADGCCIVATFPLRRVGS
jgi:signal transduction histidine kinase